MVHLYTESGLVFGYDQLTNKVYQEDQQVDFRQLSYIVPAMMEDDQPTFNFKEKPAPQKSRKISVLKIQLGTACNYRCKYCIQASDKMVKSQRPMQQDLDQLIALIVNELDLSEARFEFWGGEPLLYLNELKYLTKQIQQRLPNAQFWTISNGSLLTKKTVDWFIEHNIALSISHDGPAQELRGIDPINIPEKKQVWQYAQASYNKANLPFEFVSVITSLNCDLSYLDSYFVYHFGKDVKYRYEDVVIVHSQNAVKYSGFYKDAQETLEYSIMHAFNPLTENLRIQRSLAPMVKEFVRRVIYEVPASALPNKCNVAEPSVITVDCFGHVLSCHNVPSANWSIGQLSDYDHVKQDKIKHWSYRKNCKTCAALQMCKGGCLRNDDVQHEQSCAAKKVFSIALMKVAFSMLLGQKIVKIID